MIALSITLLTWARPAFAMFDGPPVQCETTSNFISPPQGMLVRVTPETPLGTKLTPTTFSHSVLAGFCEYTVGEEVTDDDDLIDDLIQNGRVEFVMEASSDYPQVDSPYGVMIRLPGITDEIGVALQVVSAHKEMLSAGKKEWVIGTNGTLLGGFNGTITLSSPTDQELSYLITKIAQVTKPGKRLIGGGRQNIFTVKWVLVFRGERHILGRSSVMMSTGISRLSVLPQGCSYKNITQTLPNVRRADFKGVGSTLGETSFNVPVSCYGGPSAKLSIMPQHVYEMMAGVGLPDDMEAKGVGVQLLKDASGDTPWEFSMARPLDEAKRTEERVQIDIPLRARYYQLKKDVQAGPLRVVYNVTLTYD
ncbi:fimbrial protein [Bordetella holmesii]|uniref:fimbrial protein n=1 Tax=Bordetella holmesii TaxID=35814 RepID=UPI001F206C85|nr:fimbrial protein [Bordetella holmesii]